MIRFLYLLICVLFVASCDQVSKSSLEKERELLIVNNIKQIDEFVTFYRLSVVSNEFLVRKKTFNDKGLIIQENVYSENGEIINNISYKYDKNDNLILKDAVDKDNSFVFKQTITYNEKNLRNELHFYLPDGTYKYRNIATYDADGNMSRLNWYWPTGLKAINKYTYKGINKIEDVEYDPDNKFQYKWVYTYDKNNNLIQAIQYYPDNKINSKIKYEYNELDLLVKQINYFGETIQNTLVFEYDKDNLLSLKSDFSSSGKLTAKYRYQYSK